MGTRSLVVFKDANLEPHGGEFAVLYRQFDGYPTGMGADILECFKGKVTVNGYNADHQINGPGDMAVQLIAFLKVKNARGFDATLNEYIPKPVNTPGGLYLHPPGTRDCGEEYVYAITCPKVPEGPLSHKWEGSLLLTVEDCYGEGHLLYEGPLDAFDPDEAEKSEEEGS
jgi:hypothetical protein